MNALLIKNYSYIFILVLGFIFLESCKQFNKYDHNSIIKTKESNNAIDSFKTEKHTIHQQLDYRINDSISVIIKDSIIEIIVNDRLFSSNTKILQDENVNHNCIAEGFRQVILNDNYFTIEKQSCSNRYLIHEYLTFIITKDSRIINLHTLKYTYIDRSNPDRKIPDKLFFKKDFGDIEFKHVDTRKLYIKMVNN